MSADDTTPTAGTGEVTFERPSLEEYIRRDLAYLSGISREHLAELDQAHDTAESPSALYRTWVTHAAQAERSIASWVVSNAPAAIPHLRDAGVRIWTPDDGFGDIVQGEVRS